MSDEEGNKICDGNESGIIKFQPQKNDTEIIGQIKP